MSEELERVYFVAHGGKVQGVGFRYFARKKATEFGITGWCRNTSDNKVEGEVQGSASKVESILKYLPSGPRMATVVKFTKEPRDVVEGETEFEIRHTT